VPVVARRFLGAPAVCLAALLVPATAFGGTSHVKLWTALGNDVGCGIAIGQPATQVLCSSTVVPAPKAKGFGDPGFVFLGSHGRPQLARLSQDTFVGTQPVALEAGTWSGGSIHVTCKISASKVRCSNRSHHGFTITKTSYTSF
jgi:hypothetical protein